MRPGFARLRPASPCTQEGRRAARRDGRQATGRHAGVQTDIHNARRPHGDRKDTAQNRRQAGGQAGGKAASTANRRLIDGYSTANRRQAGRHAGRHARRRSAG